MADAQQMLDEKSFQALPLHDADFLGLTITAGADGSVKAHLKLSLNEQEDFGAPVTHRDIAIIFEDSRSTGYAAPGFVSDQGVISYWGMLAQSPIINEMKRQKAWHINELKHYWFDLSSGSRIDIVAEKTFLLEGQPSATRRRSG
jgi:hypothetical protein